MIVLSHLQVKLKEQIFKENSVGILVCLGNGSTMIKLANHLVVSRYGQLLWELISQDNFAGTPVLLKANFYTGMELAHLYVLIR